MNRVVSACDPRRVEDFLRGELTQERESAFVQHLESCARCQQRLEESAGGESWRSEVGQSLSADELNVCAGSGSFTRWEGSGDSSPGEVRKESRALAEQALAALQCCLAPTDDPRWLGRIGAYEVVGVVGRGATGVVVKAFQPSLSRYVAIKLLAPELAVNSAARVRFEREAQAAAAVVHEHVVPIYAVDEFRGTPFLVMQYAAGGSLERRLSVEGILAPSAALRIGMQIAAGLSAAHAQGLIHRDIKPANILMESGIERVLITDFGLARAVDDASLTHSGFVAGTPQFMSPEQARGEGIDHRTDLFSLGSVLYTLLAGRPPFRSETAYGLLRRICDEPHRRLLDVTPTLPVWLSAIVDRLLAKSPAERFASAAEVAATLSACVAHLQNPGVCELPRSVQHWAAQSQRRDRPARRPWKFAALAASACAVFAAAWRGFPGPWHSAEPGGQASQLAPDNSAKIATVASPRLPDASELDRELSEAAAGVTRIEHELLSTRAGHGDDWTVRWNESAAAIRMLEQQVRIETDPDQVRNPAVSPTAPGNGSATSP